MEPLVLGIEVDLAGGKNCLVGISGFAQGWEDADKLTFGRYKWEDIR